MLQGTDWEVSALVLQSEPSVGLEPAPSRSPTSKGKMNMGMFDKDKEFGNRLDQEFEENAAFILWNAWLPGKTITTNVGDAEVCTMQVSRMDNPADDFEVTTVASAVVEKVKEAEEGDFPAVVKWRRVPSRFKNQKALVLQFVKAYEGAGLEESA